MLKNWTVIVKVFMKNDEYNIYYLLNKRKFSAKDALWIELCFFFYLFSNLSNEEFQDKESAGLDKVTIISAYSLAIEKMCHDITLNYITELTSAF